jgi:hypothetical protein
MFSTPQASAMSSAPEPTRPTARLNACWDEPQALSTVVQPTAWGSPAASQALRVTLPDWAPTWSMQPPTT